MVSFQCDGCADVVKKPKLDQHRARCGASFTCIDCSKTFPTPVDWKGHTSCISEAEKYQKSLYKPKPNGSGREKQSSYGKAPGAGKFQGRGASWNRPPPRSQATGANGTPLGTPLRMSPVTSPPLQDEKTHTAVSDTATAPISKGETKKHKRKSEVTNETHVESVTQAADDLISREEPKGEERKDKKGKEKKKEKKGKNEKNDQLEKAVVAEAGANGIDPSPLTGDGTGDERPKKSKKEKKAKKVAHDPASGTEGDSNGVDPSSLASSVPHDITGEEKLEKSKKKKKHKSTDAVETGGPVQDVPVKAPSADIDMVDGEEKKGKKKRRKSEVANGELEANGAVPETSKEEKPKKRKRGAEETGVTTVESATERKIKKKKQVALP